MLISLNFFGISEFIRLKCRRKSTKRSWSNSVKIVTLLLLPIVRWVGQFQLKRSRHFYTTRNWVKSPKSTTKRLLKLCFAIWWVNCTWNWFIWSKLTKNTLNMFSDWYWNYPHPKIGHTKPNRGEHSSVRLQANRRWNQTHRHIQHGRACYSFQRVAQRQEFSICHRILSWHSSSRRIWSKMCLKMSKILKNVKILKIIQ